MNCQRCNSDNKITTGSMFNTQMICLKCKEQEIKHDMYEFARKVESDQVKGGNYNYEGIGLPNDLKDYYERK
jgi:hypothetical protein